MNSVITTFTQFSNKSRIAVLLASLFLLAGCTDDDVDTDDSGLLSNDNFELRSLATQLTLVEGDEAGLRIPLELDRNDEHDDAVDLSIMGVSTADAAFISSSFTRLTLTPSEDNSEMVLNLAIADQPLMPQQRSFIITASDGTNSDELLLEINVEPVDAPDVYLLVGQSNMVGFSGDGTREALPGGLDETNPRIRQLNVSKNDRETLFLSEADFTSPTLNVVPPSITTAEDPLHVPLDPSNDSGKDLEYIGLGLSFAKRALLDTTKEIVLVPAAWSGSAFCTNDDGPNGQWNAEPTDNPELGNTWLFDRAVTRANLALAETGGILRGILWHQGESDSNERCAQFYSDNLEKLVTQLRVSIDPDRRGASLRQADSNIPFIVGTMSRGSDERGDLSVFPPDKELVSLALQNLPANIPFTELSNHDDLTPANGYPCGNTTCVHFGAAALREMGNRYYDALLRTAP
ncbi:sialate O-acetylesterase [Granulosicoccus antarcticus]|uniref:Sialate O-acetylesterase domain-containing protein n=1 Tax=Granulosicoccus antarcticus IMCC3135 TaxID=1192854 RepID=A0A2Z2NN95_9GAMM|nr:sialate O-acetylesterase [Granulosicoccus antarcticus]ASJ72932.1 hypothetical protein IMCC3135_14235 [Granulosicoccus antarcticus IMCC3135]